MRGGSAGFRSCRASSASSPRQPALRQSQLPGDLDPLTRARRVELLALAGILAGLDWVAANPQHDLADHPDNVPPEIQSGLAKACEDKGWAQPTTTTTSPFNPQYAPLSTVTSQQIQTNTTENFGNLFFTQPGATSAGLAPGVMVDLILPGEVSQR